MLVNQSSGREHEEEMQQVNRVALLVTFLHERHEPVLKRPRIVPGDCRTEGSAVQSRHKGPDERVRVAVESALSIEPCMKQEECGDEEQGKMRGGRVKK